MNSSDGEDGFLSTMTCTVHISISAKATRQLCQTCTEVDQLLNWVWEDDDDAEDRIFDIVTDLTQFNRSDMLQQYFNKLDIDLDWIHADAFVWAIKHAQAHKYDDVLKVLLDESEQSIDSDYMTRVLEN